MSAMAAGDSTVTDAMDVTRFTYKDVLSALTVSTELLRKFTEAAVEQAA